MKNRKKTHKTKPNTRQTKKKNQFKPTSRKDEKKNTLQDQEIRRENRTSRLQLKQKSEKQNRSTN